MFGSNLKQGCQNDFCAHWFLTLQSILLTLWLGQKKRKASSLKFSHLKTQERRKKQNNTEFLAKYVLLMLSVSPAVLHISTFSVAVVISLLYPLHLCVNVSVCVHVSVWCTYYLQEGALDLQKSGCDQHKNALFTDCLTVHVTEIEAEIELCVGGVIKKGRIPYWAFKTHTHTQPSV